MTKIRRFTHYTLQGVVIRTANVYIFYAIFPLFLANQIHRHICVMLESSVLFPKFFLNVATVVISYKILMDR